ncbi:MAG: sulfatase-like hydrolase/transferase, partial [Planctomycetota bacterium]
RTKNFRVPLLRDTREIERPADQTTITRRYTEESVRFIQEHSEEPFFLYLAHSLPHVPLFRGKAFEGVSPRGLYGDVIEEIDWSVGQILSALKDAGVDEHTLVLFTSDNGPWLTYGDQGGSAGPLREGKGCTFEGGMRVPAIARWPSRIPAGAPGTGLASTLDVLPTFVALAGGELPASLVHDGHDLTPFLEGSASSPRQTMAFYRGTELMAFRQGPYKAQFASHIAYVGAKRVQHDPPLLYHLERDPGEKRNLAKQHSDIVQELTAAAEAHRASVERGRSRLAAKIAKPQKEPQERPQLAVVQQPEAPDPRRPNVVLLLADDLGPGEIHALNPERSAIPTPHLDRLVGESMRFTDAHTTSSVCTPTRYSLLTGRYAWRTSLQKGVVTGDAAALIAAGRLTLGELFQDQGYHTAVVGKWHLNYGYQGLGRASDPTARQKSKDFWPAAYLVGTKIVDGPLTRGFDEFYGFHHAREMSSIVLGDEIIEERDVDEVLPAIVDRSVRYIGERSRDTSPFFLYIPLSAPHTPIVPTEEWIGKSGLGRYGDFVAQTDGAVGAIVDALDEHGLRENTVVIFSSDNGTSRAAGIPKLQSQGHFPSGPYRGSKADLWDGGHRVPLLVRWPGVTSAGASGRQLISLGDMVATFADWFDVEIDGVMAEDSVSFLQALGEPEAAGLRESLVHHSISGHFAIRSGRWKLLLAPGSAGWSSPSNKAARQAGLPETQLYDMEADPGETKNLIEAAPEVADRLTEALIEIVSTGRSTPGPALPNDAPIDLWKRE